MQLDSGITAAITGSITIKYKSPETKDRVLVDIGLNVKSWAKKQHVPGFVRFGATRDTMQLDKNSDYSRAGKHVRSHWQYSNELVDIIKEYRDRFPDVFEAVLKLRKRDQMPSLRDLYGSEDSNAVGKIKEVSKWIEE